MPRIKTAPRELFSTLARILKKHRKFKEKSYPLTDMVVVLSVQDEYCISIRN